MFRRFYGCGRANNASIRTWRTHSCVQRSHSCEHVFSAETALKNVSRRAEIDPFREHLWRQKTGNAFARVRAPRCSSDADHARRMIGHTGGPSIRAARSPLRTPCATRSNTRAYPAIVAPTTSSSCATLSM